MTLIGYKYANETHDKPQDLLDCSGYFCTRPGETPHQAAERLGLPNVNFMNFREFEQAEINVFMDTAKEITEALKE